MAKAKATGATRAQQVTAARARAIVSALRTLYPDARCSLNHENPWQLLVATVLSAQCTDEAVNKATPALFAALPDPAAAAAAGPEGIEPLIRTIGLYRAKARHIAGAAAQVIERWGGRVPDTVEALTALPGVGRKTANVVLGTCFGVPAVVVDTHVGRLARRWGLTTHNDPVKVERDLTALLPPEDRVFTNHGAIEHGRAVCKALRPRCDACALAPLCPRVGLQAAAEAGKVRRGRTRSHAAE